MKNTMLLPRACRVAGLIMFPLFFTLFVACMNYGFSLAFLATPIGKGAGGLDFTNNNLTDEVAVAGSIISLFMIAFSRLKREDEYVAHMRLKSLQWGVYANYGIFILLTFVVYGGNYLGVLFYNIATILVLFILIFNYQLYIKPRFTKQALA